MIFSDLRVGDLFRFDRPTDADLLITRRAGRRTTWRKVRGKFTAIATPTDESLEIASVLCGKAQSLTRQVTIFVRMSDRVRKIGGKTRDELH